MEYLLNHFVIVIAFMSFQGTSFLWRRHQQRFQFFAEKLPPQQIPLSANPSEDPIFQYLDHIGTSIETESLIEVVFNDNRHLGSTESVTLDLAAYGVFGSIIDLSNIKSIHCRLITVKMSTKCQFNFRYRTNDQAKNLDIPARSLALMATLLSSEGGFKRSLLKTLTNKIELNLTKNRSVLKVGAMKSLPPVASNPACILSHDRVKNGPIPADAPFLRALKITTDDGRPRAGLSNKFRQIQKFVEILDGLVDRAYKMATASSVMYGDIDASDSSGEEDSRKMMRLRITDMGSGLAYLTFAVHSHFSRQRQHQQPQQNDNESYTDAEHVDGSKIPASLTPADKYDDKRGSRSIGGISANASRSSERRKPTSQEGGVTYGRFSYVDTVGVEARKSLVAQTSEIARNLGAEFQGLRFVHGDIASVGAGSGVVGLFEDNDNHCVIRERNSSSSSGSKGDGKGGQAGVLNVLVALHACDTATDDAIMAGIKSSASVIVTAPCCHKEARRQLEATLGGNKAMGSSGKSKSYMAGADGVGEVAVEAECGISIPRSSSRLRMKAIVEEKGQKEESATSPDNYGSMENDETALSRPHGSGDVALSTILQHGIYRARACEMATDSLRALMLELNGYDTSVFEFVGGEHTAKNVMIAAVKRQAFLGAGFFGEVGDDTMTAHNIADWGDHTTTSSSYGKWDRRAAKLNGDGGSGSQKVGGHRSITTAGAKRSTDAIISEARGLMSQFGMKRQRLFDRVMSEILLINADPNEEGDAGARTNTAADYLSGRRDNVTAMRTLRRGAGRKTETAVNMLELQLPTNEDQTTSESSIRFDDDYYDGIESRTRKATKQRRGAGSVHNKRSEVLPPPIPTNTKLARDVVADFIEDQTI